MKINSNELLIDIINRVASLIKIEVKNIIVLTNLNKIYLDICFIFFDLKKYTLVIDFFMLKRNFCICYNIPNEVGKVLIDISTISSITSIV